MVEISLYQWKQLIEAGYRSHRDDYTQHNRVDGSNSIREYKALDNTVVARMTVFGVVDSIDRSEWTWKFEALQPLVDQTSWIYVPSDEDIEEWSEQELNIADEIAARETSP